MSEMINRRDFLKVATFSGMSFALSNPFDASSNLPGIASEHLKNDFFSILFDPDTGRINVFRNDGRLFISNATVRANTGDGKKSIAEPTYEHAVESKPIQDKIGAGKQLIIYSRDLNQKLDFETRYSLYANYQNIVIEVSCKNVSSQALVLKSIEPVCLSAAEGGALKWQQTTKVLTNGPMYYDAGMVHAWDAPYQAPDPYGPTKGGRLSPDFKYPASERVASWWNVGFFRGYNQEGLVCGFIENHAGLGQLIVSKNAADEISLYTEAVFAETTQLRPGQTLRSNRFMINIAPDPYTALETYANIMGTLNNARFNSIVNGWCAWFFTYEFITEDEVIRNAEYAARYLKPYGFEYIQIDEGYQRYHGDWEANERFPHGLKWLADKIKSFGLKPGIWLAPFVVSEPTEIFQHHPDWLLKHPDGRLMRVGPWPHEDTDWARNEKPKRYGLDITHPGAAKWLFDLFDTAANQWGYEMFKIDFVAWSLLSARGYYDPTVTPAQAYRQGYEIIRRAIGAGRHLNECGPGPVSVGFIDSMRIEIDQNYGYRHAAWQQYFLESSSSAPAAAKRYYFHQRTWINDIDHVCINLLSIPQAQAAASMIALSGGNVISGDRLPDLDLTRLEILKKIYPAFGTAARPVDLFDTDRHSVFALNVKKSFDAWTIIGLFNASMTETIVKVIPLERLWLNPEKTYLGYDFWMEKFFGEVRNTLTVTVLPASVTLLALHEKTGFLQVISTDRHVLQGAIELEEVAWNPATNHLSGVSTGPRNTSHNVTVYLPEKQAWVQGKKTCYHDFEGYSLKLMDQQLLRIHVKFDASERVSWSLQLDALF
ncbi:alpha-galactosidase [candidate division KSB1 bacterium]|nr:alpha-galactosidase [candidate division KSB1 bacterium]